MTDNIRRPRFESCCPDCLGLIRWINLRPEPHKCWPEQDQQAASPWMVNR